MVYAGGVLMNTQLENSAGDDIRIVGTGFCTVSRNIVVDESQNKQPHNDAIQPIPNEADLPNDQYAAACMRDVTITSNQIFCTGSKKQGIFASDGLFKNLNVSSNLIVTDSQHFVTFNGVLSGQFDRNWTTDNKPAPVVLNPLRIGGGVDGCNLWVLSFLDEEYETFVTPDITDNRHLDWRSHNKNDQYLVDFDLAGFREASQCVLAKQTETDRLCLDLRKLACEYGELVS